jgi:hypothetical protein
LLGLGEVAGPLQGDPEVLDAAEVIADQFVEPFALVAVDGRGERAAGTTFLASERRWTGDAAQGLNPTSL